MIILSEIHGADAATRNEDVSICLKNPLRSGQPRIALHRGLAIDSTGLPAWVVCEEALRGTDSEPKPQVRCSSPESAYDRFTELLNARFAAGWKQESYRELNHYITVTPQPAQHVSVHHEVIDPDRRMDSGTWALPVPTHAELVRISSSAGSMHIYRSERSPARRLHLHLGSVEALVDSRTELVFDALVVQQLPMDEAVYPRVPDNGVRPAALVAIDVLRIDRQSLSHLPFGARAQHLLSVQEASNHAVHVPRWQSVPADSRIRAAAPAVWSGMLLRQPGNASLSWDRRWMSNTAMQSHLTQAP